MKCSDVRFRMAEHDALDPPTAEAVADHLRTCPACAAAGTEQQLAVARLRSLPLREPPPGLEARLLALPTSAPAPMSMSPVLTERVVWFVLAVGTVLTAWGVWRARLVDPGGLRPDVFPLVSDERGRGGDDPRNVASQRAQGLTGDALALAAGPTAVARLRRLDLRLSQDASAIDIIVDQDNPTGQRPGGSQQGRGPRGSGAGTTGSAPEGDGNTSPGNPPAPAADDHPAPRSKPDDVATSAVPASPTAERTAVPSMPTAAACTTITITVRIIADVAGGDDAGCPGCDGQFDDRDRDLLVATTRSMPSMQVAYYSAVEPDALVDEDTIEAGDARYTRPGDVTVTFSPCVAAAQWPVIVRLYLVSDGTSEGWAACPSTGLEATLSGPETTYVQFALRQQCPVAAPPAADATATSSSPSEPGAAGARGGPEPPAGSSP